jgi:hypothetical protein
MEAKDAIAAKTERPAGVRHVRVVAAVMLWGIAIASLQLWPLFLLPAGYFFANHDGDSFPLRVLEFRDCLCKGYLFPQWCTDFRQGFGEPYFSYYQPGVFYAASLLPESIGLVHRVAWTAWGFSLAGYAFTTLTVARWFGAACGALAGTSLVLSHYSAFDLFTRGDFAEYSAMMAVPAMLYFLDGWLTEGKCLQFAALAVSSGVVVTLHACVALVMFGFLALVLAAFTICARFRGRGLLGFVALGLGAGIGTFYWLPVFGEWRFISPERAFSGHFDFSRNFMEPISLLIERGTDPIRAALGPAMVLIALSVASLVARWRELDSPQKRLALIATGMAAYSLFLMSSASAWLWETLPLLYRLQFPWRLMSMTSVAVAILVGCLGPWTNRSMVSAVAAWGALSICVFSMMDEERDLRPIPFDEPPTAADIARRNFAPDIKDEWLPKGAKTERKRLVERRVTAGPGSGASGYHQRQGILECSVRTDQVSYVDLPHFYFPVGWRATLDGRHIPLEPNPDGLMRARLPANVDGALTVRFTTTSMRRVGIVVTGLSLLLAAGIAALPRLSVLSGQIAPRD